MNKLDFDPAYSAGIRNLLITNATPTTRRRRRLPWAIGLSMAGLTLLGAGGAVAANYFIPGQDFVTTLDQPRTITGAGSKQISLGQAPTGTNSLEFTVSCSGGGQLTYPNGASQTCEDGGSAGTDDMPWTPDGGTLQIGAPETTSWRITYRYSHRQPTSLGTNANGQTYGIDSDNGHPDLIAAEATNGRLGYISAKELDAASCGNVHSPAEALKCNRDHDGKTITIPVYQSDGVTKIGVFQIG